MDSLRLVEWQRFHNFQLEIGMIGMGAFVLVTVLSCFLYSLGKQLTLEKLTLYPYLRFAYVSFFKPHDANKDAGQQSALESFYSAQVCRHVSLVLLLIVS
jgi:hypothetical protein